MEQPVEAVYHVDVEGTVTRVIDDLVRPNGILLSMDNRTLYVVDEAANQIHAYTVQADKSLVDGRKVADVPGPDGLTLDRDGNLYIAAKAGVVVLSPGGQELVTIPAPGWPSNCTFGGDDGRVLYVTLEDAIYSMPLNAQGIPAPWSQPTRVPMGTWGAIKGRWG